MSLGGQGRRGERGYAMAALLVALAVMAVVMSVALPVWRTLSQREKEEELIFRGRQYARAVSLYQRKFGNAYPPSIEALVAGRFLRKKYRDPITGGDFLPLTGSLAASQPAGGPASQGTQGAAAPGQRPPAGGSAPVPAAQGPAGAAQGLIGVVSKSTEQSIRIYEGRTRYNEWAFVAQALTTQPTAPGGAQQPGGGRSTQRPGPPQPGTAVPTLPGPGTMFPGGPSRPAPPGR